MAQNELGDKDETPCDGRKKEEVSGAALMARDFLAKRDEAGGEGKSQKKEKQSPDRTKL